MAFSFPTFFCLFKHILRSLCKRQPSQLLVASFGRLLPTVLKNRCQGVVNYRLAPLPVQSNVQMLRILIHLFAEEK